MKGGVSLEQIIYCNNKKCPLTDCERRIDRVKDESKREQLTQIDMQCICQRYTEYLANELNKLIKNGGKAER